MNFFYKRIISGALVFVTLFLACVPTAFASGTSSLDTPSRGDFWSWVQMTDNAFKSNFDKDICPKSPNTNGLHEFVKATTTVDGKTGLYYVCRYCGASAGEVGEEAYQQQVSELPATGYTSAGRLIWQPTFSDFDLDSLFSNVGEFRNIPYYSSNNSIRIYSSPSANCLYIACGGTQFLTLRFVSCFFTPPIDGAYSVLRDSPYLAGALDSEYLEQSGDLSNVSVSVTYRSDGKIEFSYGSSYTSAWLNSGITYVYFPVFEITPYVFSSGGIYDTTTRPTTITGGNYGIVGDNGTINTVTNNNQIVNETNNIYYNPATGETKPIVNWTYDYGDRTYTLDLEGNVTVDVRYGDDNITITENNVVEGDTIVNNYTIYYMIDGTATPGPTPSICPHIWREVDRTEPACTSSGKAQYVCSQCGETKVETLKATGHTWQVLRTVQTAYDEEGNLVQQGYTIYQCAVCTEQYKDDQGVGPPGGSGDKDDGKETIWDKISNFFGSIVDGIFGIFEAILGKLLDALTALSEMLMDKVKDVVEVVLSVFDEIPKLFGGFLDFLGIVFPFLPSEITLLLTFGIIAVVFIGIIKALRR